MKTGPGGDVVRRYCAFRDRERAPHRNCGAEHRKQCGARSRANPWCGMPWQAPPKRTGRSP